MPLPSTALIWFGVLGGPVAWGAQFIANLFLTFAQCNTDPRRQLPLHAWELGLSIAAATVAAAAEGVSVHVFCRTRVDDIAEQELRGEGSVPPVGRINFLAMIGLLTNFLSFAIIAMTAIGAPLLTMCQQS
jgi:hypothetical protein